MNKDVRKAARCADVNLWQVAAELGVSEPTFYRWLRTELPEEKKAAIMAAIEKLSKEDNE